MASYHEDEIGKIIIKEMGLNYDEFREAMIQIVMLLHELRQCCNSCPPQIEQEIVDHFNEPKSFFKRKKSLSNKSEGVLNCFKNTAHNRVCYLPGEFAIHVKSTVFHIFMPKFLDYCDTCEGKINEEGFRNFRAFLDTYNRIATAASWEDTT